MKGLKQKATSDTGPKPYFCLSIQFLHFRAYLLRLSLSHRGEEDLICVSLFMFYVLGFIKDVFPKKGANL